jgi:adenylate kinase
MVQLSTGDMLRAAVAAKTPVGLKAKAVMDAGDLVSDEIVTGILSDRLDQDDVKQGFILDGYPRTTAQAQSLEQLLADKGMTLDHVIELAVDEDALVDRITGRFSCASCGAGYHDRYKLPKADGVCDVCGSTEFKRRPDDNEQTVRNRMTEYRAKTAPILPYYEAKGLVSRVDGMAPIADVEAQIEAILDSH